MIVEKLSSLADVSALARAWDGLSGGVPFRSWTWLGTWWEHYRTPLAELFVLAVRQEGELVALAPWYVHKHPLYGRVVRFLGDGEVCSDYLSVLCRSGMEGPAASALARWLLREAALSRHGGWSLLEFDSIDAADLMMRRLIDELACRGALEYSQPAANCWRVSLPAAWEQYVATLCKSHRRKVRAWQRDVFDTGRGVWHTAANSQQWREGWEVFIDLHQRRRRSLGESGCFSSPRFAAFHRDVSRRLLDTGQLRLHWLTLGGRPAAAAYFLAGEGIMYAYQSGMEVELLDEEPGHLAFLAALREAVAGGYQGFDLLRGDEPYKALWRAKPRPAFNFRILQGRAAHRLVYGLWSAQDNVKAWIRGRWDKQPPATANEPAPST